MTDAEIWELILISQANSATYFAIFLTIVSGYLVVAYTAGAKLLRSQIRIINTVFILSTVSMSFATYAQTRRGAFLLDFASPKYTSPESAAMVLAPTAMGATQLAVTIACLIFMWQVRNPKNE